MDSPNDKPRKAPGSIRRTARYLRRGTTPQVLLAALKTLEQTGVPGAGTGFVAAQTLGLKGWLTGLLPAVIGFFRSLWQNAVANAQLLEEKERRPEVDHVEPAP